MITFGAGPNAPDSISIKFNITDDNVALEPVESYEATLTVLDTTSGIDVTEGGPTTIKIQDDDGRGELECI